MALTTITNISRLSMSGSLASGGWRCHLTGFDIGNDITPDREIEVDIKDLLLGTWDDFFYPLLRGYIPGHSIRIDWQKGMATFEAETGQYYFEKLMLPGFVFIQGSGENAHMPSNLTHPYIVRHLIEVHTNAAEYLSLDILMEGHNFTEYTIEEQSLWAIIKQCAKDDMKVAYFDSTNIFHYKRHPAFLVPIPSAVMTFTEEYCTEIIPERRSERQCSQVYARGFIEDPTQQVEKLYPATPDPSGGEIVRLDGIPVSEQGDLDEFARRHYLWKNRDWKVTIRDIRNHKLDIGDVIGITYTDSDEGIAWSDKKFIIDSINYNLSWEDGIPKLRSDFVAEELVS